MESPEIFTEDFDIVLYKNNLWMKGKKNFFGEDYSENYIRFTFAEDFTFNIYKTEIRKLILENLDHATFSVELIQQNPSIPSILQVNVFIGSEEENKLHHNEMFYPEIINYKNKSYLNLTKFEMPYSIYSKRHLHEQLNLIILNARFYSISKYLSSEIFHGKIKLDYKSWNDSDEPELCLELCPKMNKILELKQEKKETEKDNNQKEIEKINEKLDKINEKIEKINERIEKQEMDNIMVNKLYLIILFFALFCHLTLLFI